MQSPLSSHANINCSKLCSDTKHKSPWRSQTMIRPNPWPEQTLIHNKWIKPVHGQNNTITIKARPWPEYSNTPNSSKTPRKGCFHTRVDRLFHIRQLSPTTATSPGDSDDKSPLHAVDAMTTSSMLKCRLHLSCHLSTLWHSGPPTHLNHDDMM